jgi:hypothetical protein
MQLEIENNYHHPTFIQYKKIHINLFSLYSKKKNLIKEKKTKLKRKKIQLEIS